MLNRNFQGSSPKLSMINRTFEGVAEVGALQHLLKHEGSPSAAAGEASIRILGFGGLL